MKRCTATAPRQICASSLAHAGRRWTSHSSASLTDEALLEKVGARLNDDKYGEKITVDATNKTISTENGELPMSPLFDPRWIKSRRRQTKRAPTPASGPFQKQLQKNPFAQALATPMRYCAVTKTHQPRYFFQRFDLVRHPETDKVWMAPANDDYSHIQRNREMRTNGASTEAMTSSTAQDGAPSRLSTYIASQKSVFEQLSTSKKKLRFGLIGNRSGMAVSQEAKSPVWRHDMDEVVLQMLRREACDELVRRSRAANHKHIQPCSKWEEIKDVERRGCILWLPRDEDKKSAQRHATYDVEGANYGGKMVVHNLRWLMGEDEVARLRSESDLFRDNDLLVLKTLPTKTMGQLHLLLWKLHGYYDVPSA